MRRALIIGCAMIPMGIIGLISLYGLSLCVRALGDSGANPEATTIASGNHPIETPATALPKPTPTVVLGTRENPYPHDAEVRVGDVMYRVLRAEARSEIEDDFMRYTAKGKFVIIALSAVNRGKEPVSIETPRLYDGRGRRFAPSGGFMLDLEPEAILYSELLNPDLPEEFSVVFDVPADAEGLRLELNNGGFLSEKTTFVALGI